jgi:membrane protein implicated in regulation of membrane protease activity
VWIAWLVLGVVLLYFELHHLTLYALFGALGAFAAAAVAGLTGLGLLVQGAVAVGVAVVGVGAVRPQMSTVIHRHPGGMVARGVHGGLIGQDAVTLDEVGTLNQLGHARLAGERWLAVSGTGELIPAKTPVTVTAVEGTTLTVWPTHELFGPQPPLDTPELEPDRHEHDRHEHDRHEEER